MDMRTMTVAGAAVAAVVVSLATVAGQSAPPPLDWIVRSQPADTNMSLGQIDLAARDAGRFRQAVADAMPVSTGDLNWWPLKDPQCVSNAYCYGLPEGWSLQRTGDGHYYAIHEPPPVSRRGAELYCWGGQNMLLTIPEAFGTNNATFAGTQFEGEALAWWYAKWAFDVTGPAPTARQKAEADLQAKIDALQAELDQLKAQR